jgi:hypothetical protein
LYFVVTQKENFRYEKDHPFVLIHFAFYHEGAVHHYQFFDDQPAGGSGGDLADGTATDH